MSTIQVGTRDATVRVDGYFWGILRISMGWLFIWTFFDSLFGLGFPTPSDRGWVDGVSPTADMLAVMPIGPFESFYKSLSGYTAVDWVFMVGFALAGVTLISGVAIRIGTVLGALLFAIMYSAIFMPPPSNPFLNDHIVYILIMGGLFFKNAGRFLGLGNWWEGTAMVKRYPRWLV